MYDILTLMGHMGEDCMEKFLLFFVLYQNITFPNTNVRKSEKQHLNLYILWMTKVF